MKPTAPGSSSSYICLRSTFPLHFYSDLLNRKYKNTLLRFILFVIYYFHLLQFISRLLANFWRLYSKGIDNPFNTSGCEVLLFGCRGYLRCVARFSYWFDNLGFITEGNTYHRCAASSLPLWGNTDVVLADMSFSGAIAREQSKGISGTIAGEDLLHN